MLAISSTFDDFVFWSGELRIARAATVGNVLILDTALLGEPVGAILKITRFRENNPKEIERPPQQLASAGVPVKARILNAIALSASSYYGYANYHYAFESDED